MKVILDSGVFVQNFQMKSPSFETFLNQYAATGHQFVMLEVVLDEVLNKYREVLYEQKREVYNRIAEINKITGKHFAYPISEIDFSSLCIEYTNYLKERLKEFKAVLHGYPEVPHKKVVERALQRKKPFDNQGQKGYRDALIWESILELISKEPTAVGFVSLNPRDFADENQMLHPVLKKEVDALGNNHMSVTYFHDLEDFVSKEITPLLNILADLQAKLTGDGYKGFSLLSFTLNELYKFIETEEIDPEDIDLPSSLEILQIGAIEVVNDIKNIKVYALAGNDVLVTYEALVSPGFTFLIGKSEYYGIEYKAFEKLEIWEPDWNDDYMLCYIQLDKVMMKINLILNQENVTVQSAEMVDIAIK